MVRILLAEDDKDLNALITSYLKSLGYAVFSKFNGLDALNVFYENHIDIILSDIMMPLCDGFELARNIREKDEKIPILFMSARDDKPSKQIGYKVGIDDYITKPFDLDELGFKLKAISRRLDISTSNELTIKNFTMNAEEHTAKINGEDISLSVREFDILFHLLSNPKKIFTRSALMEQFWDYDSSATSRTVDVYLSKLRDKTKTCDGFEIQTIHGLGYKVILK
ncbi:MAG: response regulator transcription factor [Anaeroplasmataceae bacterium]|nr:response regulator transcription factor [Anaeroplasmataceae bacterium]MDE6414503.1 response regulator transcription factor [Anaeroplasmataceae bacterium]